MMRIDTLEDAKPRPHRAGKSWPPPSTVALVGRPDGRMEELAMTPIGFEEKDAS
ncbi:hypothetical protein SMICM17S_07848 [Streptomyces microflavus]